MSPNPVALMGLFKKYGALRSVDVTPVVTRDIASALGLPATEDGITLAATTIASGDLESLSDYVGQPERLKALMATLAGKTEESEPPLARCPHCSGVFELHFERH